MDQPVPSNAPADTSPDVMEPDVTGPHATDPDVADPVAPTVDGIRSAPLGSRAALVATLPLDARPAAFAELDAAIVAELRAIEDL